MLTPEPSTSSRASDPLHDLQTSTYTPSRPPNLASVPPGLQISAAPCLYDIQTSRPPYLHAFQTSIPTRLLTRILMDLRDETDGCSIQLDICGRCLLTSGHLA